MSANALIGSSIYMEWQFYDKADGVTPIEVSNPILKVFGPDKVQIGNSVTISDVYKKGVGNYYYYLTIPDVSPYIDVEVSCVNGSYQDVTRDRIDTYWSEDDINSIPAITLTLNTNTYATLGEADTYMSLKLNADAWNNSSATNKAKALVQATQNIDTLVLKGVKMNPNQPLCFPRYYNFRVPVDSLPLNLKKACCEEALAILQEMVTPNQRQSLQAQGVKRIKFGDTEEEYTGKTSNDSMVSSIAKSLMKPFIASSVSIDRNRRR